MARGSNVKAPALLAAATVLALSGCSTGWSDSYRSEVTSQCVNATSKAVGYAVTSWCECVVTYREENRTEEEDRSVRNSAGLRPRDLEMRAACRHAETPEMTAQIDAGG